MFHYLHVSFAFLLRFFYLQETRDVPFVADSHGDHILKQPEERPLVAQFWSSLMQETVKLEKQPPSTLCEEETGKEVLLKTS